MNVTKEMSATTEQAKQNVLQLLSETFQEVSQGISKGFVLIKLVSTDKDGFVSSSTAYNINRLMICELIYKFMQNVDVLDLFRLEFLPAIIDALKERVGLLNAMKGGDAPKN